MVGVLMVVMMGCRSSQESGSDMMQEKSKEMPRPAEPGPGIPPGYCRVAATVVSIDPTLSAMTADPCAKAPCVATVRVDEMMGFGSGFVGTIGKGSEVKVRFKYTLASTAEIFPGMSPALPGLEPGTKFQADMKLNNTLMGSDEVLYVVEGYVVRP
jgi:hypothetical protein